MVPKLVFSVDVPRELIILARWKCIFSLLYFSTFLFFSISSAVSCDSLWKINVFYFSFSWRSTLYVSCVSLPSSYVPWHAFLPLITTRFVHQFLFCPGFSKVCPNIILLVLPEMYSTQLITISFFRQTKPFAFKEVCNYFFLSYSTVTLLVVILMLMTSRVTAKISRIVLSWTIISGIRADCFCWPTWLLLVTSFFSFISPSKMAHCTSVLVYFLGCFCSLPKLHRRPDAYVLFYSALTLCKWITKRYMPASVCLLCSNFGVYLGAA